MFVVHFRCFEEFGKIMDFYAISCMAWFVIRMGLYKFECGNAYN